MCVKSGEGCVQHGASHLRITIIQSIGNKEKEKWGDLRFIQVLGEFVESQSNSTPDKRVHETKGFVAILCIVSR